jgi:hypothetical protein
MTKGDPSKQPPECKSVFTSISGHPQGLGTWSKCPNLRETGGDMDGEWWSCEVCGARYFLDYEEMR